MHVDKCNKISPYHVHINIIYKILWPMTFGSFKVIRLLNYLFVVDSLEMTQTYILIHEYTCSLLC